MARKFTVREQRLMKKLAVVSRAGMRMQDQVAALEADNVRLRNSLGAIRTAEISPERISWEARRDHAQARIELLQERITGVSSSFERDCDGLCWYVKILDCGTSRRRCGSD